MRVREYKHTWQGVVAWLLMVVQGIGMVNSALAEPHGKAAAIAGANAAAQIGHTEAHGKSKEAPQSEYDDHEETGIPGDDHLVHYLHLLERLSDYKNPIVPFLIGAGFAIAAKHTLAESLASARDTRRDMLIEAEEGRHSIHEKEAILREARKLEARMKELDGELAKKEADVRSLFRQLKDMGRKLEGDTRSFFDQAVNKLAEYDAHPDKMQRPFSYLERWLDTPEGARARQSPQVDQWVNKYQTQRTALLEQQKDFYRTLVDLNLKASDLDSRGRTHYRLVNPEDPGSRIAVEDQYGNHDGVGRSRSELRTSVGRHLEECEAALAALTKENADLVTRSKFWTYYLNPTTMGSVRFDVAKLGGWGAVAAAAYGYFYTRSNGQDALHNELKRELIYFINWNAQGDILTQLSSEEGQQDLAPVFKAVHAMINSEKFASQFRDMAVNNLRADQLNGLSKEQYVAAQIEAEKATQAATTVALANTARLVGAWYMTKPQMLRVLRGDTKVFRDQFLSEFLNELPTRLWPATGKVGFTDARLKQAMQEEFAKTLSDMARSGEFPPPVGKKIALPGLADSGHN